MKEFFAATRTPDAAGLSVSAFFTAVAAALGKIPVILILFMAAVAIDYLTGWIKAKYFCGIGTLKPACRASSRKLCIS